MFLSIDMQTPYLLSSAELLPGSSAQCFTFTFSVSEELETAEKQLDMFLQIF